MYKRQILLDDRLVTLEAASRKKWKQCLRETIVFLSARTRVVWIGRKQDQEVLSGSQSAGQVDFVPRGPFCISAAVRMVERRLLTMERKRILLKPNADADSWRDARLKNLGFAEIFRHELNNPLTGILGNAELLLLDARRGKFLLPAESLKRLETISSLAVRLRETVRELGDRWAETGEAKSGCTQVSAREEEDLPPAAHG